jgi:hypothetical protein
MPKRYGGFEKLTKEVEEDRAAGKDRQSSAAIASWENMQARWEEMRGNRYRRGSTHTRESRRLMSESHKALWRDPRFFAKMWRARRARQFREKGKCLLRFPRLGTSTRDQKWLDAYRKRYRRITGRRLGREDLRYYEGNEGREPGCHGGIDSRPWRIPHWNGI